MRSDVSAGDKIHAKEIKIEIYFAMHRSFPHRREYKGRRDIKIETCRRLSRPKDERNVHRWSF